MFDQVFGLPTHALVMHAVVVLLPLAAAAAIAVALVPALRRRYGVLVALLTLASVAAVPVATRSGQRLYARKSATFGPEDTAEAALMERHRQLGEQLPPWALLLLLGTLVVVAVPLLAARSARTWAAAEPVAVGGPGVPARLAARTGTRDEGGAPAGAPAWTRWVGWAGTAAVLVGGVLCILLVIRIGHAGSAAVWDRLDRAVGTSTAGTR